jgi:hypothetical protein
LGQPMFPKKSNTLVPEGPRPSFSRGTLKDAMPLIMEHHYTKRRTADPMHVFLWSLSGEIVATAVFTSPVNKYFGKGAIELARLVRLPSMNFPLTMFLSECFRWLKKNTKILYCLSYADSTVGHVGTIYQASNFTFVAISKGNSQYRNDATGKIVSGRSFDQHAAGNKAGWTKLKTGKKYLYVYPLHEKRERLLARFGWEPLAFIKKDGWDLV